MRPKGFGPLSVTLPVYVVCVVGRKLVTESADGRHTDTRPVTCRDVESNNIK